MAIFALVERLPTSATLLQDIISKVRGQSGPQEGYIYLHITRDDPVKIQQSIADYICFTLVHIDQICRRPCALSVIIVSPAVVLCQTKLFFGTV